ncbi:hypothetical protein Amsp01_017400 [Amycolatopsis sp. NBRC 101858]|nr:hypothetical protein Amsp01_017400 [Amycolatopsis sp. NBRC 101858]
MPSRDAATVTANPVQEKRFASRSRLRTVGAVGARGFVTVLMQVRAPTGPGRYEFRPFGGTRAAVVI